jgi:hypothetical protein
MINRVGLMSKLIFTHRQQYLAGAEVFLSYLGKMAVNVFTNLFLGGSDETEIHAIAHQAGQRTNGK